MNLKSHLMFHRIKVFLLLQACFFVSCAQKVKLEQGNIVEIKYSATANLSLGYTYYERKGCETIAVLDTLNQEIFFYNITDSKKIDSIGLNNIERKFGIKKIQFFTVGENGNAYLIFNKNNTIVEIDGTGKICRTVIYKGEDKMAGKYTLSARPEYPMLVCNKYICSYNFTDDNSSTDQGRDKAFANNSDVLFIFPENSTDTTFTIKSRTGRFPSKYRKYFYYDFFPSRCINDLNDIVYSFPAEKYIYIYSEDKLKDSVAAPSKFHEDKSAFPMDSMYNYSYIRKYFVTEPKYIRIIFDPFRKLYYRIYQKRCKYLNKDGTFNKSADWSMIVLDNTFKTIGEFEFDGSKYTYMGIIPVKNGILIGTKAEEQKPNTAKRNIYKYTLYTVIQ